MARQFRFAYKDYAKEGRTSYKTLPVFAFIGRLIWHIPDKHFKMVRYAGILLPVGKRTIWLKLAPPWDYLLPLPRRRQHLYFHGVNVVLLNRGSTLFCVPHCQMPMVL